jgi:4-amino-4-deoxy-L-arabinose transferase-like glycosyltransferase
MTLRAAVAAGVVLRIVLIGVALNTRGPAAFLAADSPSYLAPATALASDLEFEDALGRPELFRTPGYPLLLATGIALGHPVPIALGAQLVLSAVLILLTYRTAQRVLGSNGIAICCAWLVALEPTLALWSVKVMPETLFVVLVVGATAAALRATESGRPGWTAAAALMASAAAYVRPIAYPLLVLTLIALFVAGARRRGAARHAVAFFLVCVAAVGPWHARNWRVGRYAGFSTVTEYALFISVGGSIVSQRENAPFVSVRAERAERTPREATSDEALTYSAMRADGLRLLRSSPLAYGLTHARGVVRTLLDPGAIEYLRLFGLYPEAGGVLTRTIDEGLAGGLRDLLRRRPLAFWTSATLGLLLLPLVALPAMALTRPQPASRTPVLLLAGIAVYFLFAGGGVPGSSRFRVPAVPSLVLMSGLAVVRRESDAPYPVEIASARG